MAGPDPKSVAVEGIGYGPLATATQGYLVDSGTLQQVAGVTSAEAFGVSAAQVTVEQATVSSAEQFGTDTAIVTVAQGIGLNSTLVFGDQSASNGMTNEGLDASELFGTDSLTLSLNEAGLGSSEAFGTSYAAYDTTLTQNQGVQSGEAFGTSNVAVESGGEDDYTNDDPALITKRRPLRFWPQRRGGSSKQLVPTTQVDVFAEMLTPSLNENAESIQGHTARMVSPHDIVVKGQLLEACVVDSQKNVVRVEARMLQRKTEQIPQIVVRATKVA